jgi:hypothetical protein
MAMFDGFIACWYYKYKYDMIRPETYINQYIDPNWKPFLQTPPFPEYIAGIRLYLQHLHNFLQGYMAIM